MKTPQTKEEIRIEFYGNDDARARDHDELHIMQSYADQECEKAFPEPQDNPALLRAVNLLADGYDLNTAMVFSSNTNQHTFIKVLHAGDSAERFRHAIMTMKQKHSGGLFLDVVVRPIFGMTEAEQPSARVKELEARLKEAVDIISDADYFIRRGNDVAEEMIILGLKNRGRDFVTNNPAK